MNKYFSQLTARHVVLFFLVSLFAIILIGENAICRNSSCMRKHYRSGDRICYQITNSFYSVSEHHNGRFASLYFSFRQTFFPAWQTVVRREYKVIGLLEVGAEIPFEGDIDESERCSTVR